MKESNQQKLMNYFFNYPMKKFHVRQLSRDAFLNTKTVMNHLRILAKKGIIRRIHLKNHYPYYEANRLSKLYLYEKSHLLIKKIIDCGLIEYLEEKTKAKVIILFGSVQKGIYYSESDIDLFIQSDKKRLKLDKFEKKIGREISILFEKELKKLSKGLLNNIINGDVLSGKLEVT